MKPNLNIGNPNNFILKHIDGAENSIHRNCSIYQAGKAKNCLS